MRQDTTVHPVQSARIGRGDSGGVAPWLLTVLIAGLAGGFYWTVYRPLAQDAAQKEALLGTERTQTERAQKEANELRAELQQMSESRAQVGEELAQVKATQGQNEQLLTNLQKELAQSGAEISAASGRITVTLVDRILFKSGEANLMDAGKQVLRKVGGLLKAADDRLIQVSGHTDIVPIGADLKGPFPTNWELSTARATNVVRFLQEDSGIDPKHLMAAGYGPYRPVASNGTATGRAKNRRIEILLLPEAIKVVKGDLAKKAAAGAEVASRESHSKQAADTKAPDSKSPTKAKVAKSGEKRH